MAGRDRKHLITVYLSDDELRILKMRCKETKASMSLVIRELIVYGFNYYVDYKNLTDVVKELNSIGRNLNQIAVRANASGSVFRDDIEDMRKEVDEIWRSLRSMLSKQVSRKQ